MGMIVIKILYCQKEKKKKKNQDFKILLFYTKRHNIFCENDLFLYHEVKFISMVNK